MLFNLQRAETYYLTVEIRFRNVARPMPKQRVVVRRFKCVCPHNDPCSHNGKFKTRIHHGTRCVLFGLKVKEISDERISPLSPALATIE